MIHDKLENFHLYYKADFWKEAFDFLSSLNEKSEEKRYDLGHGMYAIIMSYPTKDREEAVLESHRKYVDIQSSITGAERIDCCDREGLEISEEYDSERDVMFYSHPESYQFSVDNLAGRFTVLFPDDAHMPQLKVLGFDEVKKVVVKIPVELFS